MQIQIHINGCDVCWVQLFDNEAQNIDLIFDCKYVFKIIYIRFNKNVNNPHINGGDVCWVDKLTYLGVYIVKYRFFEMDTSWVIRKFYAVANAKNCHTKNSLDYTCLSYLF